MRAHHRQAIDRLRAHFEADATVVALLIAGSVAKGWEADDSDVDFMLVVTEAEFARREAAGELTVVSEDFSDYPRGYVDGKVVDLGFLDEVAERGSEPARAAFRDVIVAFSRDDLLDVTLERIGEYPAGVEVRLRSFNAQVQAMRWFVAQAERRDDPYLLTHAAANLVLFGGRMILAHNRILFPFHKWFLVELGRAPEKPDGLLDVIDGLLRSPSGKRADELAELVLEWREWPEPTGGWGAQFMVDTEWSWRAGLPALADR